MMIRNTLIAACIGLYSTTAFAGGGCEHTLVNTTITQYGADSLKVEQFDCIYPNDSYVFKDEGRSVGTLYTEGKEPVVLDGWWHRIQPINLDLDLKGFRAILLQRVGSSNSYEEIQLFNNRWEKVDVIQDPVGFGEGWDIKITGLYKEDGRILIDKNEADGFARCNACQHYYTVVYELTDTGLVYLKDKEGQVDNKKSAYYQENLIYSREEWRLRNKLEKDLERTDYQTVIKEWVNDYDKLEPKFKNTIYMRELDVYGWFPDKPPVESYEMTYGDLYGVNKGFYWGLCGKYSDEMLSSVITEDYWGGGKHEAGSKIETDGYRAAMVYWYVKSQILDCKH